MSIKVKYLPCQPHCFSFGGFELQMLNTLNAINTEKVVIVERLNPWDKDRDFDILHLWGLELSHYSTIKFARSAGKKVVITALLPNFDTFRKFARFFVSSYIDKVKFLKQISHEVDCLIVLNHSEAVIAHKYFNIPSEKIHIIPVIIGDVFFKKEINFSFLEAYNLKGGYILTIGNVRKIKNQLNLALACEELKVPLVVIGGILDGNEEYASKLNEVVVRNKNMCWIKAIDSNSILLNSAYQNCSVFALPSFEEHQPTSALEAVVIGKPVLLANRSYARQKYFDRVLLCDPSSVQDIAKSLKIILNEKEKFSKINSEELEIFKAHNVAKSHIDLYKQLK